MVKDGQNTASRSRQKIDHCKLCAAPPHGTAFSCPFSRNGGIVFSEIQNKIKNQKGGAPCGEFTLNRLITG